MILERAIDKLAKQHGGLRALARSTGVSVSYLCRLRNGTKDAPSDETLERLGLRRVVVYLPKERP